MAIQRRTVKYYRSRVIAELKKYGKKYVERKYGTKVVANVMKSGTKSTAIKSITGTKGQKLDYVGQNKLSPKHKIFADDEEDHTLHSHKIGMDYHVKGKGGVNNLKGSGVNPGGQVKTRGAFAKAGQSAPSAKAGWQGPAGRTLFSGGGEIPETAQAFKRQLNFNLDNDEDLAQGSQTPWAQPTSISSLISGQLRLAANQPMDAMQSLGATSVTNRAGSPFGLDPVFGDADRLAQENPMGAFGTDNVMYDLGESPEEMEYELDDEGHITKDSTAAEKAKYFTSPEGMKERMEIGNQAFANKYNFEFKSTTGGMGMGGFGGTTTTIKPKTAVDDKFTFGGWSERYGAGYENVMPGVDSDKYTLDDYKAKYGGARITVSDKDRQLWMSLDPNGYKKAIADAQLAENNAINTFYKNFPDSKDVLKDSGAINKYNESFKKSFSQYFNGQKGDIVMGADGNWIPKPTTGTGPGTQGDGYQNPALPMYNTSEGGGVLPDGFTSTSSVYNPWGSFQGADNNMYGPSQGTMQKATMDAMSLANAYFAPQRAELAYELGDMETDMRRMAVNLGRQVDDPVLQAKLYKEGMRAVRTLDIQQNTFAFQMADSRRKEELANFQFYDQLAQNEAQLRIANWQFTQNMDLAKSQYNLQNWIAMQNASQMNNVGAQAPSSGGDSTPQQSIMAPEGNNGNNIYTKRYY